ncbi:uncharacterized protein LOC134233204 isoform X2 [Saccostrea cucullata]
METKVEPYPESEEEIEPYSDNEEEIEPFPNDVDDQLEGISETHNEACKGINCANHDGIELRQKACPQNCISRLSSYDLLELRKNKPSSQKEHTQWLLDFFFEHSTQDTVCHLVCGKEICEKCWREVHKVSIYKYNKYLTESRNGVREKIHANTASVRPSIQNSELIKTLQKLSYIKESKVVKNVWDFKDWMVHHSVNNHGLGDQYEFRIHALDKDSRAPIFHYRRGEGERWLPDCEDENTFEHQQDKCGIRIFKDMDFLKRNPKCVVPTDKSMYLSRIIQETCPKLLESGLLKPAEKQWWEEFSSTVRESYLTPSINVNFPLENLIHVRRESSESSNSIASVERTLQELVDKTKRKSLVYTGRYLTQKKRKTAG